MSMQTTRVPIADPDAAVVIRSVVVGEDTSVAGRAALAWAARHVTGDIHVVRAVSPSFELLESGFQLDSSGLVKRANEELETAVHDVANAVDRICPHVIEDNAPNALLDVARRFEVDAIVVGSNGHERFGHLVGANIGRLLHLSDIPVIVVPEDGSLDGPASKEPTRATRIVVGVVGDAHTDAQLVAWARASTPTPTSICLLHAISPTLLAIIPTAEGIELFEGHASARVAELMVDGLEASSSVVIDHPISALQTASRDAALIVVGSHRSSRMTGFLTGSIAQHLPTMSACPVAIVPVTVRSAGPEISERDGMMKLRFDLPVRTTDGPFGDLGDVVIDPIRRKVTHLVVEPHHRHYQARLVPIDLIDLTDDGVSIRLDAEHVRHLPGVADSDFVRLNEPIDLGDDWDIGIQHIVAMPYGTARGVFGDTEVYSDELSDRVSVNFDRIPKGECEIRRASHVVSADGHTVGIVDGFIADDTHIEGVIVRTGWIGFRHLVVVPVAAVARVASDCITITLASRDFHRLHPVDELEGVHLPSGRLEQFEHSMAHRAKRVRARVSTLLHRSGSSDDSST